VHNEYNIKSPQIATVRCVKPVTPEEQFHLQRLTAVSDRYCKLFSQIPHARLIDVRETIDAPFIWEDKIEDITLSRFYSRQEEPDQRQVIDWIVGVLKDEAVQGEWFIRLQGHNVEIWQLGAWARVVLAPNFGWVPSVWEQYHSFELTNIDVTKYYSVFEFASVEYEFAAEIMKRKK
jgi:hypothetical protein